MDTESRWDDRYREAHGDNAWRMVASTAMHSDAIQIQSGDKRVATVSADLTAEIEDGAIAEVLSTEAKAHAALISAAPDLFAVVRAWVCNGAVPKGSLRPVWDAAKAALKKARQ